MRSQCFTTILAPFKFARIFFLLLLSFFLSHCHIRIFIANGLNNSHSSYSLAYQHKICWNYWMLYRHTSAIPILTNVHIFTLKRKMSLAQYFICKVYFWIFKFSKKNQHSNRKWMAINLSLEQWKKISGLYENTTFKQITRSIGIKIRTTAQT